MATPHYSFIEIDCPENPGRRITVARNTRDDPVGQLFVTNQISKHQYEAAQSYAADHEAISGRLRAASRGPEDTSGWRQRRSDGDRLRKPHDRIKTAHAALGPDQTAVVQAALAGHRVDIGKLCQALNSLAEVYGLATRTRH
jgi:hypothetical protein